MPSTSVVPLTATVVGGGPVGCLVAIQLRKRGFLVDVYEQGPDIRQSRFKKSHSFNLTLTLRGLRALDEDLRELLYQCGVPMPQRVVHHGDGSLSYQRYGSGPEHHLLSIPRGLLHRALLDKAAQAGARIFFDHRCIGVDPNRGQAAFAANGSGIRETTADLLIGCDGANSIVRHEMSRRGARMQISQEYIANGYLELSMPPAGQHHALLQALADPEVPHSGEHGLHIWPRGEFMLMAQPNVDLTYTATLFMPLVSNHPQQASFEKLRTPRRVADFFGQEFPDAGRFLPQLTEDFFAAAPAALKTVKCSPYHHGRTVLIGDAAHTMVPFYGQGINCSFQDVRTFFEIFDRRARETRPDTAIQDTLAEYSRTRKGPGDAIADLSVANMRELSARTGQHEYHARDRLEKELHRRFPDLFMPLYDMVAFTEIPYDEVVRRFERTRSVLDELCRRFDVGTEAERIIDAYSAQLTGAVPAGAVALPSARPVGAELELSVEQQRQLLETVVHRIGRYQQDLADGRYPVSFVHDSINVSEYTEGRKAAAALREDRVPESGTSLDCLLTEIFELAVPNGTMHPHPGFMAHVPSGGLFQGAVGEFITRTLNRFVGVWVATPGFIQIESNVIRWFCDIMGYGPDAFGYLTTGGSIANFMAVRCALEDGGADAQRRGTVYVASEGHYSLAKAAKLAGLAADQVRVVGTRDDYSMNVDELRAAVERDRLLGLAPVCVIATAGTTNTGAVDDLPTIAEFCREQGIWLHVDACFGGFFALTSRGRELLAGIDSADSIAVDAHKSLFLPHGTSALLVRDRARLRAAFEVTGGEYLPGLTDEDEIVDFCNYGPELSREVRGLAAWLPIKLHGITAFERSLDQTIDLADHLADGLRELDGVQVLPRRSPHLPVVAFTPLVEDGVDQELATARLCELICTRGNAYLTTTRLPREGLVVRACILHHQTDKAVVDRLIADTAWAVERLHQEVSEHVSWGQRRVAAARPVDAVDGAAGEVQPGAVQLPGRAA